MTTEERWVSVEDVAAHLGVAKDSVYRWIDERGLPAHRVGRLFRFKLSEIDGWVRQGSELEKVSNPATNKASLQAQTGQIKENAHSRKRSENE